MRKLTVSNNQLLKDLYESVDVPREKSWDLDEPDWAELCTLCNTAFSEDRDYLVRHLWENHKTELLKRYSEGGLPQGLKE